MKKAGKILAAGCLAVALCMPVTAYAAEQVSVQLTARTGVPTVGSKHSAYENVAISHVSNYVNVRTEPNTTSGIVGKIYNNCAAEILATVDGEGGSWYQIQSGSVNGYIKAEYFITGAEAEKIARDIGTVYVTINTATLRLREEPNTESRTLTLLSQDAEYVETKEEADFVEIQVDADLSGYVHKDYIKERVEFRLAVSVEEEQQQKEEAERIKREADEAIAKVEELRKQAESASAGEAQNGSASGNGAVEMPSVGLIAKNPNEPADSQNKTVLSDSGNKGNSGEAADKQENGTSENNQMAGNGQTTEWGNTSGPSINRGNTSGPSASDTGNKSTVVIQKPAGNKGTEYGPGGGNGNNGGTGGNLSAELTSATRTAMVAYAKQFLGNPYVYGGTSLTDGADCSGFTMKIYEHFGISTGRSSREQAVKGREISLDAIKPGDLLFYASGDTINHVAMYIGGGQIIHASTEKTGIKISTAYYRTPCKAVTFLD